MTESLFEVILIFVKGLGLNSLDLWKLTHPFNQSLELFDSDLCIFPHILYYGNLLRSVVEWLGRTVLRINGNLNFLFVCLFCFVLFCFVLCFVLFCSSQCDQMSISCEHITCLCSMQNFYAALFHRNLVCPYVRTHYFPLFHWELVTSICIVRFKKFPLIHETLLDYVSLLSVNDVIFRPFDCITFVRNRSDLIQFASSYEMRSC